MPKPLFTLDGLPIIGIIDGMLVLACASPGQRRGVWYQTSFYRVDEQEYDQIARERAFVGLESL
jgi:hypothetical protein